MKKLLLILLLATVVNAQGVPTVTSRAKPHWREKYPTPLNEVTISNFDEGIGFGHWTASSGDSIRDDFVNVMAGTKSIEMYTHGVANVTMAGPTISLDCSSYDYIVFRYYISRAHKVHLDSLSSASGVELKLGSNTTFTDQFNLLIQTPYLHSNDGWYTIYIDKKSFIPIGSPSWSNIVRARVVFYSRDAQTVTLTCDRLAAADRPIEKGGILFNIDSYRKTIYTNVSNIFNRYGISASLFYHGISKIMDGHIPTGDTLTVSDLRALQSIGWDIGARGYYSADTTTKLTVTAIDTQFYKIRKLLSDSGFKAGSIYAWPWGAHNNITDSIASHYFDYCRSTGGLNITRQNGNTKSTILSLPSGATRFVMPTLAFNNHTLADLTAIVDSAIANRWVSPILIHNFGSATSGATIDTTVLNTFLAYIRSKVDSGYLSPATGRFSNYFSYAPDSCIENISHANNTIIDSISTYADSMRVVLKKLNGTVWDSISGSPMKKGGSLCTLTVRGLTGTYTVKSFGVANSGHVDSGNIAYEATFTTAITVTTQPENDTVLSGQQGVFTVGYTGSDVQVAWYKDSVFTGVYGDTLRIAGNNGDSVQAVLWNDEDTVSSGVAYLTVYTVRVDSIGVYDGVYLKGQFGIIIDSILVDSASSLIVAQDTDEVRFVPPNPLVWSRDKYQIDLFTAHGTVRLLVKYSKSGGTVIYNFIGLSVGL